MTTADLPILNPSHFDFAHATPVISAAQKFVIPIPCFSGGGEPLVYPADHPEAGQRICDWQGKPVGDTGIVFWNPTDRSWQAAPGDGRAVVIMNQVSGPQVARLFERYMRLGDPQRIPLTLFKAFLVFAGESIGVKDLYHSDWSFVAGHMTPVDAGRYTLEVDGATFGFLKRDQRDIAAALYIDEPFLFDIAGADRPVQRMEEGGVVVAVPNPKGGPSIHAIQPEAFVRTYRLADGGRAIAELSHQVRQVALAELLSPESSCA